VNFMKFSTSSITELLYILRLRDFEDRLKHAKERDAIWISALVQCPRKWLYTLKYPEIAQAQFRGFFVLGEMVHKGPQALLSEHHQTLGFGSERYS